MAGTEELRGIYRSLDSGKTWRVCSFQSPTTGGRIIRGTVNCLGKLGPYYFAGTTDSMFRSSDGGATWTRSSKGLGTNLVQWMAAGGGAVYSANFNGVARSLDSGATWVPLASADSIRAPSSIYAGDGDGDLNISTDQGATWISTSGFGTLHVNAIAAVGTSVFFADEAGVFRTTDGGKTWTRVDTDYDRYPVEEFFALAPMGNSMLAAG